MTAAASRTRKIFSALVVATVVGVALAPSGASAKDHKRHGYGAAAFVGGLALGAIAASSAAAYERDVVYERECWIEKRKRYDAYGYVYVKKVKVCD